MARKKPGLEVDEADGDNMVNPRDSGEIGRLQKVEYLSVILAITTNLM